MSNHRQRLALLAAISVAIPGCSEGNGPPPPKAYAKLSDRLKAASFGMFGYPCAKKEVHRGIEVLAFGPSVECYRFSSPESIRGIWLYEFEASHFLEGQREPPKAWAWTDRTVTLEHNRPMEERFAQLTAAAPRRAYYIEFIGRRMLYPFKYRSGASETIVNVDRLIRIREVKAPKDTLWCKPKCRPFAELVKEHQTAAEKNASRQ
jgi:hypothetical protein